VWHDFHQRFVARIGDSIAAMIRPHYVTKIDENVYLHELSDDQRRLLGRPDVALLEGKRSAIKESQMDLATRPKSTGFLLPLPLIPIPLKPEHADAVINLQSLLHEQYDAAGYADYIYAGQPRPQLSEPNRAWAEAVLSAAVPD
jgi:hypothetical protein